MSQRERKVDAPEEYRILSPYPGDTNIRDLTVTSLDTFSGSKWTLYLNETLFKIPKRAISSSCKTVAEERDEAGQPPDEDRQRGVLATP